MADLRRAVREWATSVPENQSQLFLVALSGGGDSGALAWAAGQELPKIGVRVGAVIVNHQLQPDSSEVASRAAERAAVWGLSPVMVKVVDVGTAGGPEDAARSARYRALSEALAETGASGILLAHTEDDQAETVLLGLARGSGPGGLKGMPVRDGAFHRPLLGLSRATLRQALLDAGESWWEDPHNSDPRFARVRVRDRVMPVMEAELGPGISRALARTAELFRQDSEALDAMAQELWDTIVIQEGPGHWSVPVSAVESLPDAVASRVLKRLAEAPGGGALGYVHIQEMMNLLKNWRGQSELSVPGARVLREAGAIHARIAPQDLSKEEGHGI
jgi:tRNA(Ile)-lysidine synthase